MSQIPSPLLFEGGKFIRKLGDGKSADVEEYKYRTGSFAIKKFEPSDVGIDSRALWELHSLRLLHGHPNIVRLHGAIVKQVGPITYVNFRLQLCTGSMWQFSRQVPLMERIKYYDRISHQLMTGLNVMKAHGIIHRDIKPDNLLMNWENFPPDVMIADFGLAYRDNLVIDYNIYTLWYRPPEVILGKVYDYRADLWATGLSLIEYLTGMIAFYSNDSSEDALLSSEDALSLRVKALLSRILLSLKPSKMIDVKMNEDEIKPLNITLELLAQGEVNCCVDVKRLLSQSLTDEQLLLINLVDLERMLEFNPLSRVISDIPTKKIRKTRMPSRTPNRCIRAELDDLYVATTWITTISEQLGFKSPTVICSIDLLERYIAKHSASGRDLQVVATTCLFLGCELMEPSCVSMYRIVGYMKEPVALQDIKNMQIKIIDAMNYFMISDDHYEYCKEMSDKPVDMLTEFYDLLYLEGVYPGNLTYQQIRSAMRLQ